jgi:bifunctional DNA-binding transcriptional regulator/antitoxin component of YhaV-PrlF toxin-antitoxin module
MSEFIVEVNQNRGINFPSEVVDKMALAPGDKMILRFDNTEEHLVIGKLPMDAPEKASEIKDTLGKTIKI